MKKVLFLSIVLFMSGLSCTWQTARDAERITPYQFKGSDTERIQAAVNQAAETTGQVIIYFDTVLV